MTRSYYPLFLNIKSRRCVVVGGGQVALRKVQALLDHGAKVTVVSPELCPELVALARNGEISAVPREYRPGDLYGAFIAIAATDHEDVNLKVSQDAGRDKVLVNVVDNAELSDFIAPSYLRRGDITIAISSSGKSPALARKIRIRLEKEFGDEYAELALLLDEVRTELKQKGLRRDGDSWQEAIDLDSMVNLLKKGERAKAKSILLNSLNNIQEKAKINE